MSVHIIVFMFILQINSPLYLNYLIKWSFIIKLKYSIFGIYHCATVVLWCNFEELPFNLRLQKTYFRNYHDAYIFLFFIFLTYVNLEDKML